MAILNDYLLMKSIDFEFLKPKCQELSGLGGFAEAYAHRDPITSIPKLRTFCEESAKFSRYKLRLSWLIRPNMIDLLDDYSFNANHSQGGEQRGSRFTLFVCLNRVGEEV